MLKLRLQCPEKEYIIFVVVHFRCRVLQCYFTYCEGTNLLQRKASCGGQPEGARRWHLPSLGSIIKVRREIQRKIERKRERAKEIQRKIERKREIETNALL
jgi:hypothetical protein